MRNMGCGSELHDVRESIHTLYNYNYARQLLFEKVAQIVVCRQLLLENVVQLVVCGQLLFEKVLKLVVCRQLLLEKVVPTSCL